MFDLLRNLAAAFGLSTSAGLNAYIPMLMLSLFAKFTPWVQLEEPWSALTSWWIIGLTTVLLVVEIFADKFPVVDTVNDIIQTLFRPTAGAILFAASTQSTIHVHPFFAFACGLILAGGVHVVKTGSRPVLAAMTGGLGNPIASTLEDVVAVITSFVAIIFPYLIIAWLLLLAFLIFLVIRWRRRCATAR